jgi:hypothetical protein
VGQPHCPPPPVPHSATAQPATCAQPCTGTAGWCQEHRTEWELYLSGGWGGWVNPSEPPPPHCPACHMSPLMYWHGWPVPGAQNRMGTLPMCGKGGWVNTPPPLPPPHTAQPATREWFCTGKAGQCKVHQLGWVHIPRLDGSTFSSVVEAYQVRHPLLSRPLPSHVFIQDDHDQCQEGLASSD